MFLFFYALLLIYTDIWDPTLCINTIKPWTTKCPWGYTAILNTELLNTKK